MSTQYCKMLLLGIFLLLLNLSFTYSNFENTFSTFMIRGNYEIQKRAAEGVIERVLGKEKANFFNLKIDKSRQNDGFTIVKNECSEKVSVTGSSGISLVWGVNYYLKNLCNCHISWDGDQLDFPIVLPSVNITVTSNDKLRFYQNVCTSSYSFVWWDWSRWEREIDWMAFNGINLVLAFTAQEAIWQRVYDALGLSNYDFTGPAFLAWNRMGNLRNYSYSLTKNWHIQQMSLQHKILRRLRDLGITPVLPAFCGFVPRSFEKHYPLAKLTKMTKWNKFSNDYCCPFLLDSDDILFPIVSHIFLREYISEFGTNHIYSCDMFNENKPASGNLDYLSNISKSVYNGMNSIDPGAIWMVQGWMFIQPFWQPENRVKAFVTAVPIGKMLILDLQSDLTPQYNRVHSYFGQPFIWCTLHNFGGQLGLYGHLHRINKGIPNGRHFVNSSMVGIGITPEGIDQNYIMYAFTLESAFRSDPINLNDWVSKYALGRYGKFDTDINEAWLLLKNTVYNYKPEAAFRLNSVGVKPTILPTGEHISKNILTRFPSLHMSEPYWYNRSIILDIFQKFLLASDNEKLRSSLLFQHDFIDVTRQTLQIVISCLYFKVINAYTLVDISNFQETAVTFLDILNELDVILASSKKFLLGNWLESAKNCGVDETEKFHYEFNARNQITLWGPNGEIRDYAAKQWSGLISDYYKPRWEIFLTALNNSILGIAAYNSTAVKEKIFLTVERPFSFSRKKYPTSPSGNPVAIIKDFNARWKVKLDKLLKNFTFNEFEVKSL